MFRGWIVVIVCFLNATVLGILTSFGNFFLPLATEFGLNHTNDSLIPALTLLVFSLSSLVAGYLDSALGFRKTSSIGALFVGSGILASGLAQSYQQVLFSFGVVMAIGSALIVISSTSLVIKWFVKKRGVAIGISVAGSGVGSLVLPTVTAILITADGWRTSFLVIGAFYAGLLLIGSYYMQTPQDLSLQPYGLDSLTGEEKSKLRDYTTREAMSTANFWAIYAMFFLGEIGVSLFLVHVVPLAVSHGIGVITAGYSLGVFGAGNIVARVLMGFSSDRLPRGTTLIIDFASEFIGLLAIGLSSFLGPSILVLFASSFLIGFGYGGFLADFVSLTGSLFGVKWSQNIWAIFETAYGSGGLVGPLIGGLYFDTFGVYDGIFQIAAILVFVSLLTSIIFTLKQEKLTLAAKNSFGLRTL